MDDQYHLPRSLSSLFTDSGNSLAGLRELTAGLTTIPKSGNKTSIQMYLWIPLNRVLLFAKIRLKHCHFHRIPTQFQFSAIVAGALRSTAVKGSHGVVAMPGTSARRRRINSLKGGNGIGIEVEQNPNDSSTAHRKRQATGAATMRERGSSHG